jgi:peptidoglycan/LPS O-acetylase OafA/YrhL
MTALEFVGNEVDSMNIVLTKLVFNFLLIQEWIPFKYRSLNGVSWFLCTCTLAYFIFPYILRYMEKSYTKKKAYIAIIFSFVVEILIVCLGNYLGIKEVHNSVLENNIQAWLIYYFPLSRVWDVFIGANIGFLFLKQKNDSISESTALEPFAILLNVIVLIINTLVTPKHAIDGTSVVLHPNFRWFLSLLFTISSSILVYIFALDKGKISKFLTGKITLYLAKISSYGFLIHYVVLAYLSIIYRMLPKIFGGGYERFWWDYGRWLNLSIGFVITLICIELYVRFENRIKRIKLNAK